MIIRHLPYIQYSRYLCDPISKVATCPNSTAALSVLNWTAFATISSMTMQRLFLVMILQLPILRTIRSVFAEFDTALERQTSEGRGSRGRRARAPLTSATARRLTALSTTATEQLLFYAHERESEKDTAGRGRSERAAGATRGAI
ncbi:unnamed protein product [Pieris brassicae]|uniref:Uncharacterized protein n=1 Tax=Pieris brassicae TaxID=7116 RepID=A0A9P0T8Q0_PIEBR|nr:unnamed protein product [Pieris brassicae]